MKLYRVLACIDGEVGELTLDDAEKDVALCYLREMLDDGSTGWMVVVDPVGNVVEQYSSADSDPSHAARQEGQMALPIDEVTA